MAVFLEFSTWQIALPHGLCHQGVGAATAASTALTGYGKAGTWRTRSHTQLCNSFEGTKKTRFAF